MTRTSLKTALNEQTIKYYEPARSSPLAAPAVAKQMIWIMGNHCCGTYDYDAWRKVSSAANTTQSSSGMEYISVLVTSSCSFD